VLTVFHQGEVFGDLAEGHGPPVLLLHGWGRSRSDLLHLDCGEAPVLALDLPGHGTSPAPSVKIGTEGFAELVADCLRESFSESAVVFGHSFGGRVALQLATKFPELTSGLVLSGVPFFRAVSKPSLEYRVVRSIAARASDKSSLKSWFRNRYGSSDYLAADGVMRDVFVEVVNEEYEKQLAALGQSGLHVEMVWGESDTAAPLAQARRAQTLLGSSSSLHVVAAGHDVHKEASGEVALAISRVRAMSL